MRSYYSAQNVTDVALYTEPEEIYLMKKNGDLISFAVLFLIESSRRQRCAVRCHCKARNCEDQQLHRSWCCSPARQLGLPTLCQRERTDLCHAGDLLPQYYCLTNNLLSQSAPEAPSGRHINVYTYSVSWEIDLQRC